MLTQEVECLVTDGLLIVSACLGLHVRRVHCNVCLVTDGPLIVSACLGLHVRRVHCNVCVNDRRWSAW